MDFDSVFSQPLLCCTVPGIKDDLPFRMTPLLPIAWKRQALHKFGTVGALVRIRLPAPGSGGLEFLVAGVNGVRAEEVMAPFDGALNQVLTDQAVLTCECHRSLAKEYG